MFGEKYFELLIENIDLVKSTQRDSICKAASEIATRMIGGGRFFLYDSGHIVAHELACRAGGLMAFHPINNIQEFRQPFLVRKGDIVIFVSVSGRHKELVETVQLLKKRGVLSIGLTSLQQAEASEALHESGKKLHDVADIVIDTCGVSGDAVLEIEGLDNRICPVSGVIGAAIMWALTAQIVKELLEMGVKPHTYVSYNIPDGKEINEKRLQAFEIEGI